jgi:hypothetical protein
MSLILLSFYWPHILFNQFVLVVGDVVLPTSAASPNRNLMPLQIIICVFSDIFALAVGAGLFLTPDTNY